jgi:hypothetical protein
LGADVDLVAILLRRNCRMCRITILNERA